MAKNDPLFYLKSKGVDLAALAASMGWKKGEDPDEDVEDDGSEDVEDDGSDEDEDMDKSARSARVDQAALEKAIRSVEAGLGRPLPAPPGDGLGGAANVADVIDATGLLKSLVDGLSDDFAGLGGCLDELVVRSEASGTLAQAVAMSVMRLEKSLGGRVTELQRENAGLAAAVARAADDAAATRAAIDGLLKSLGRPETPRTRTVPVPRFPEAGRGEGERAPTKPEGMSRADMRRLLNAGLEKAKRASDKNTLSRLANIACLVDIGQATVGADEIEFLKQAAG